MTGQGVIKYSNGATYRGQFSEGMKHGKGYLEKPNGEKYEGAQFRISNKWWLIKYKGDFKSDSMHGSGVYTFSNGNQYKGS